MNATDSALRADPMSSAEAVAGERVVNTPANYDFDLFVVHAGADAAFVRKVLVPALELPPARVLYVDALPIGGLRVSEIARGVSRSRYTVAVLSPAYLDDRWAEFGAELATYISLEAVRVIPLQLVSCELPVPLEARVCLDFTDKDRWEYETRRLYDLLHAPAAVAAPIPYPYPGKRVRQRWVLGILGGAAVGALLVLMWPRRPGAPPPAGMVRFSGASVRLGVFPSESRPLECTAMAASDDCAMLPHPGEGKETQVAAFDLDQDEVTNREFAAWLNTHPQRWRPGGDDVLEDRKSAIPLVSISATCNGGLTMREGSIRVDDARVKWPVVCVTWQGASQYCRDQHKRLPLEAEWELAAKGREGRRFPWGDAMPEQDGVAFGLRDTPDRHPRNVGSSSQDRSPQGVHDLGGNVAEWVESDAREDGQKAIRGGSWASRGACLLLSSSCKHIPEESYGVDVGFRCASRVVSGP